MIILDFSQIVFSNLHQHLNHIKPEDLDADFLRHFILNSIRGYKKKYGSKYGQMVIAVDNRHYWRREIFPHYKAHRKAQREEGPAIDWDIVFGVLDEVKNALKEFFQYKVIEVEGAEADDVIGVLARYKHQEGPIMIVSSDGDFKQLQRYKGVSQFSPHKGGAVTCTSPMGYLREHIMRGDKGDGIPNYLTPSDFFVKDESGRQKSVFAKKVEAALRKDPEDFCENEEQLDRFRLNEQLIDLSKTPDSIKDAILTEYDKPAKGSKMHIMTYMGKHKMKYLLDRIEEF